MNTSSSMIRKWLSSPILKLAAQSYFSEGLPELPENRWPQTTPEAFDLDSQALQAASLLHGRLGKRQGLVLIKDGQLFFEDYYVGQAQTRVFVYSLTKSVAATLVGLAWSRGMFTLAEPIRHWLAELPPGLHPDATIAQVLGQVAESHPPGSAFAYNSGAVINSLSLLLAAALKNQNQNLSVRDFAHQALFRPLGMSNSSWQTLDAADNLTMGYGMRTTCRDIARLGQLYLNQGRWQGQEILSPEFIRQATQAQFPEANPVHGFLWWLNPEVDHWIRPLLRGSGQLIPGAPEDLYMATGMLGNFLFVFPSQNLIIVSLGRTFHHKIESLIIARQVYQSLAPALAPLLSKTQVPGQRV